MDSAGNLFLPAGMSTTKDLKHELLQNKDVKNLSTAALVNLVKKLESAQHQQQQLPPPPEKEVYCMYMLNNESRQTTKVYDSHY